MKYNSLVFDEEEWVVDIKPENLKVTGAGAKPAELVELLIKEINLVKANLLEANHDNNEQLERFPMDVVVPFVLVVYGTQFAEKVEFSEKFIEFGFSLSHFNMLSDKHKKLLKNIEGSFYNEKNFFGQEAFVQLNIDDNFFNSMSAMIVAVDQMFSMRELSKLNKNAKPFIQMLTTSTIGAVLPQFSEEYGADKKIDIVVSPSHALFLDGLPNSKISGIYVDKNGNWKVRMNINIQVNLEKDEDQWIPVRNIYATFVFTFKATMDQKDPSNKKVVMLPKRVELSAIKVMKDEEEMSMEQMMIQSMASIQFEQAQKMFREVPIPVGDIMAKNPAELQCFGFNIADLDISYKKSQA